MRWTSADELSSIGMLLGYHLLWSTTANVVGTEEQADRYQKLIINNNFFIGGAVSRSPPRKESLCSMASSTSIPAVSSLISQC
jgi:hypothetical protein